MTGTPTQRPRSTPAVGLDPLDLDGPVGIELVEGLLVLLAQLQASVAHRQRERRLAPTLPPPVLVESAGGPAADPRTRILHTVPEVAEVLGGVTERYVYHLMETGGLHSVKLGRRRLVPADDLLDFVKGLGS